MNAKSASDSQNAQFPGQIGESTMTKVIGDTIEAKLVASRSPDSICIVCDDYSASRVRAKVSRGFCVCPRCLKSADFNARLTARAEELAADAEKVAAHVEAIMKDAAKLRETASAVKTLIGKVKAPTFEEWLDAEVQEDVMARSRVTTESGRRRWPKCTSGAGGTSPPTGTRLNTGRRANPMTKAALKTPLGTSSSFRYATTALDTATCSTTFRSNKARSAPGRRERGAYRLIRPKGKGNRRPWHARGKTTT
jgi:hypothetical protein